MCLTSTLLEPSDVRLSELAILTSEQIFKRQLLTNTGKQIESTIQSQKNALRGERSCEQAIIGGKTGDSVHMTFGQDSSTQQGEMSQGCHNRCIGVEWPSKVAFSNKKRAKC